MEEVQITYIGHSCFAFRYRGQRIVLDPYADGSVPGLADVRLEAEYVYCSHFHGDHGFTEGVTLKPAAAPAFTVEELDTDHDDVGGAKRGRNTVRIFHFGKLRVAHLGDLGRLPTEAEYARLSGVDCLLIPVGGFFTIDAVQAKEIVDNVRPRVTVPMHYRSKFGGFDVIAPLEDFTKLFPAVERGGDTLTLTEDTPKQVLILTPKNGQ